jgi:hypothetical protein
MATNDLPNQPPKPASHAKHKSAYYTACEIQDTLKMDIDAPKTAPAARAQLARAWDALEERKRVLRMKPAPKPIDTTKMHPKHRPGSPGAASICQE